MGPLAGLGRRLTPLLRRGARTVVAVAGLAVVFVALVADEGSEDRSARVVATTVPRTSDDVVAEPVPTTEPSSTSDASSTTTEHLHVGDIDAENVAVALEVVESDERLVGVLHGIDFEIRRVEPIVVDDGETVGALVFLVLADPLDLHDEELLFVDWTGERSEDGSWYSIHPRRVTAENVRTFVAAVDLEAERIISEVPGPSEPEEEG